MLLRHIKDAYYRKYSVRSLDEFGDITTTYLILYLFPISLKYFKH